MSSQNFIKNITSKDINLSKSTISQMIKSANIDDFTELCQKSDFIFPFLKERISNDFVKLINKDDLNILNEFSKIYCPDLEDLIVNSWIKFASEDLTDEILNLFEEGTLEQKTYCAKYFSKILDPLALEYLNKYAFSDFEPLKSNCAQALSAFGDCEILDKMKNIILNSDDEFEKLSAYNFICAYNGENQIRFVIENCFNSPFLINILSNILDFNEINYLKTILDENTLKQILQVIIEEYPEEISLDTCYYWQIIDLIKIVYNFKDQYSNNILLIAKQKFSEFRENDIYTFDFDKNIKNEIKNISDYLNSIQLPTNDINEELKSYNQNFRFEICLKVIEEYNLEEYCETISDLINENKLNCEQMAITANTLKKLNKINLINENIVDSIENENIKALIKSYM